MANISPELKKQLHAIAQKQAEKIAKEFEDKMTEHYKSVLDWYYGEPYQTNPPHYKRTYNLKNNSYVPYFKSTNSSVISGIEISGESMDDYKPDFSGEDLLRGFFFVPGMPSVTWHGGDWHGGRGTMAKFSAAEEMYRFYHNIIKDFRKKYEI